jgi:hypothetical protein
MSDYKSDAKVSRHMKLHKMGIDVTTGAAAESEMAAMEREARRPPPPHGRLPDDNNKSR